ncbi:hypothetical protein MUP77_01050 [Candidatus Bathyarchaeota archaeon]|nr:hypothetical protein [Candidatus Bathyarchaeota archaeon]
MEKTIISPAIRPRSLTIVLSEKTRARANDARPTGTPRRKLSRIADSGLDTSGNTSVRANAETVVARRSANLLLPFTSTAPNSIEDAIEKSRPKEARRYALCETKSAGRSAFEAMKYQFQAEAYNSIKKKKVLLSVSIPSWNEFHRL